MKSLVHAKDTSNGDKVRKNNYLTPNLRWQNEENSKPKDGMKGA